MTEQEREARIYDYIRSLPQEKQDMIEAHKNDRIGKTTDESLLARSRKGGAMDEFVGVGYHGLRHISWSLFPRTCGGCGRKSEQPSYNFLGLYHVRWNEFFGMCTYCVTVFIDAERKKLGMKTEREMRFAANDAYCKKCSALVQKHGVEKARTMI